MITKTFNRCRLGLILGFFVVFGGYSPVFGEPEVQADLKPGDRLRPRALNTLPLGSIKPGGWLHSQLRVQAEGLSGRLDEFWPDVKDSAWIGGKAEGWERTPYWLDGFVPLAYELDDPKLKEKVHKYFDYILTHQHEDGWLGPVSDGKHAEYDAWPMFVMFKALMQYEEATKDPRVVPAMLKCSKRIGEVIAKKPLFEWGKFRAADLVVALDWLYEKTHEESLISLAEELLRQGFDWRGLYERFPYQGRVEKNFSMDTHGVNTAMGWKFAGVRYRFGGDDKDRDAIFQMLEVLDRTHGQANGLFSCDEHLAGLSPSQGSELCTVVEAMYSLETLESIIGDPRLGDRLEKLTYNALPATFKPDMTAHQYDQQVNQVVCKVSHDRRFATNGPEANLFGLEPNFGCCTANMHQGWPKFVAHLWMKIPSGGLAAIAYAPCSVATDVSGVPVNVQVRTDYPFRETMAIDVTVDRETRFPLKLRIPAWAEGANVEIAGKPSKPATAGTFLTIEREWKGTTQLIVHLPMRVRAIEGYRKAVSIERGPLVYALRVGTFWKRLRKNPPFDDWEVFPTTPWNYALRIDRAHPEKSIAFYDRPIGDLPFSPEGAPITAIVDARSIPWWTLDKNAAADVPESPVRSDEPLVPLTLVPYGCTTLRVASFPTLDESPAAR